MIYEDIYIEKKCDMPDKYIITVISSTEKNNLIHAAELAINLCHPCDPNNQGNTNAIIKKWKSVESVIPMTICYNVKLQDA